MLDILWEDPHGLAINKPAGLLTHPGGGARDEPTLEALIRRYLRPDDPGSVYLGTVHRLDRPVSGVNLWAKTPKAAQRWGDQFARRLARKEYWAIVAGPPVGLNDDPDRWDDWLTPPDRSGRAGVAGEGTPGAVRAVTRVEVTDARPVAGDTTFAWLKLYPETGRTHQLRAQAAARGRPIVGDLTYGSTVPFDSGISLHARSLTIEHPIRRIPITLTARPPGTWGRWKLDWG